MYGRKKNRWKHGGGAISIIIDVLQSRLHTLAHTVLAVTAASEHDKFHNVGSGVKWGGGGEKRKEGKIGIYITLQGAMEA